MARRHLRDVVAKAVGGLREVDDSGEILSYRQAFFGLLAGLLTVAVWLWTIGLPFPVAVLFVFGAMVLFMALTRVVAEGGIPAMRPPLMTSTFAISAVGTSSIGTQGLVALGFSYGWHAEVRSFVMASVANGLKMSEMIRGQKRRLFWAIVLAILVSLAGSSYVTLVMAYEHGGINLNPLFFSWQSTHFGPMDMAPRIAGAPEGPRWDALQFMGIGAGVMAALMWARHHFLWWPLNPLGVHDCRQLEDGPHLLQCPAGLVPEAGDPALRRCAPLPQPTALLSGPDPRRNRRGWGIPNDRLCHRAHGQLSDPDLKRRSRPGQAAQGDQEQDDERRPTARCPERRFGCD